MSTPWSWYGQRLRAMSVAEVAHRSYRAARYPIDQIRMRSGHYARPSATMRARIEHWQGPARFYFDREQARSPVSIELVDEAESICAGQRRVLGLGRIPFPPDGWHLEPRAQAYWPRVDAARVVRAAPAHFDPRLTWEMNRGHEWVTLARVHASTGDPRFLAQLVRELASWRRGNPIGVGINWASAMEAAVRIHSLVWCAGLLRGTPGVMRTLAEAIYEHAVFVADHRSYFSSANNHLLIELSALIVAALTLGGDLMGLHASALARLTAELECQVFPDGVNAEMATHYHVFVLEALVLVAHLQRAHGMPSASLETTIERMASFVDALRCADGSLLQQGDSDDGCIVGLFRRQTDPIFAAAASLRSRDQGATQGRSKRFVHSGQVVVRSRRLHAVLDAGPFGFGSLAAHAHCDALSIALAMDGRRVLVDRGTYRYNGDRRDRDCYRLTAAHNTAQIGSLEQASPAGAFLWSRWPTLTIHRCELTQHGDIVQASHDGFPGWTHRRTLVHQDGVLAIVDEFQGAGHLEPVTCRYHFAPELAILGSGSGFRATHGETQRIWLVTNARLARVVSSRHSDEYAASTSAPTIELCGASDRALVVVIAPADMPQATSIEALARFAAARGIQLSTAK